MLTSNSPLAIPPTHQHIFSLSSEPLPKPSCWVRLKHVPSRWWKKKRVVCFGWLSLGKPEALGILQGHSQPLPQDVLIAVLGQEEGAVAGVGGGEVAGVALLLAVALA